MDDEQPFSISVSQAALDALQHKLAVATFPSASPKSDDEWDYGVPLKDVERLVARWKNGYDWRAAEAALNVDLPQYTRSIEVTGHGIFTAHYVHKKSENINAIPLLFLHGWPGHFAEVRKVLPLLSSPGEVDAPSFHVVAPSLPGFGFTSAPLKKGFAIAQHAEFAHNLMLSLGYDQYVIQGGDWGFLIGQHMATTYGPKHAKAWHTNFPAGNPPTPTKTPFAYLKNLLTPYSAAERRGLQRTAWFYNKGQGYFALQSTMPQTLGYSLADSPVGLLAWIYEKLVTWTDDYPWDDDEVLTWISLYLFSTPGPAVSVRIYYEATNGGKVGIKDMVGNRWASIPVGLSFFPRELFLVPKTWAATLGNVVFQATHAKGGHFAAHETPEALVSDLRKMFGKGGKVYGVVKGREGY